MTTIRMMHFRITEEEYLDMLMALDPLDAPPPERGSAVDRFIQAWNNGMECPSL